MVVPLWVFEFESELGLEEAEDEAALLDNEELVSDDEATEVVASELLALEEDEGGSVLDTDVVESVSEVEGLEEESEVVTGAAEESEPEPDVEEVGS